MPFKSEMQLLFIHIPKTGGTSIEHFFDMCHPENFWFERWDRDRERFVAKFEHLSSIEELQWEPQHYPANLIKMLLPGYDNYFKFAFVRNPFTRVLSEYFWHSNQVYKDGFQFNPRHFQFWLDVYFSEPHNSHKELQTSFLDDSVDFIGKYESFEYDFQRLLQMLKLRSDLFEKYAAKAIPRLNTTGHDKSKLIPMMLRKSRKKIINLYRQDFKLFGYEY